MRVNNWISSILFMKAEEDKVTATVTNNKEKLRKSEIEAQPSSIYETPRSSDEINCNGDGQIIVTPRQSIIPLHLTPPVMNSCGGDSCTTYPKLRGCPKHNQHHNVKRTARDQEDLFSVSVSPLSSLDVSLGSSCYSAATTTNGAYENNNNISTELVPAKQRDRRNHRRDFFLTKHSTNTTATILDQLGKSQKTFKQSMKAWKKERKEKKSAGNLGTKISDGINKDFPSHWSQPLLDSRPLLLLMKKVKEKQRRNSQHNNDINSATVRSNIVMRQSSNRKENIIVLDEFGNFVDSIDHDNHEEETLIASVVKVGIGEAGVTGERRKKTKTISGHNFECNTFITPNNGIDNKASLLKKSGKNNSDYFIHTAEGSKNTKMLTGGVGRGHLYAEQQRKINQLNMQLMEKEKLVDLLQQQLSEAKQEIENSIDFYAMSVIKLEGNIIAMSEEHESELAKLKEQICVLTEKTLPDTINNENQQKVEKCYERKQNRPFSAPNATRGSHYHY
jgi:hypothetical protein